MKLKILISFLVLIAAAIAYNKIVMAEQSDYATLGWNMVSGHSFWRVNSSGNFVPGASGSYDIGSSSLKVNGIYANAVTTYGDNTIGDSSADTLTVNSSAIFAGKLAIPTASAIRGTLTADVTGQIYLNTSTAGEVCVATGTLNAYQWMKVDGSGNCSN